jgi:hypothetical protein
MPNWMIFWGVGLALGLVIGFFAARDSAKEKPIRGGLPAKVCHYLAASLIVSGAPTALLVSIFYGQGGFLTRLLTVLGIILINLAVAAVLLLGYAVFEIRAPEALETAAE